MSISRREFLQVAVALAGTSGLGCSTSTPATLDAPPPGTDAPVAPTDTGPFVCGGATATIALNHGHVLDVPLADVLAGTDRTYDVMGTSMHTHMVTVTAADFATMQSGGSVMLTTTSGSMHMHTITVRCTAA